MEVLLKLLVIYFEAEKPRTKLIASSISNIKNVWNEKVSKKTLHTYAYIFFIVIFILYIIKTYR